jgi:hypothetical protein
MGPIDCPGPSVRNYHCALRIIAEDGRSRTLHGGSLKSRNLQEFQFITEILCTLISYIFKQLKKQSRYRPGVAQRVPGI